MCGIVGYVGKNRASGILLEGLKRLEYRGYDSAGLALWKDNGFQVLKKTGRVEVLNKLAQLHELDGDLGISHTRWATHGGVTDTNAHPHVSDDGRISIVHNGVIENYAFLKKELESKGIRFHTETDTEVLANLIAFCYGIEPESAELSASERVLNAMRQALMQVEGTYGIALMCADLPHELFGARKGSPLILGVGNGEKPHRQRCQRLRRGAPRMSFI